MITAGGPQAGVSRDIAATSRSDGIRGSTRQDAAARGGVLPLPHRFTRSGLRGTYLPAVAGPLSCVLFLGRGWPRYRPWRSGSRGWHHAGLECFPMRLQRPVLAVASLGAIGGVTAPLRGGVTTLPPATCRAGASRDRRASPAQPAPEWLLPTNHPQASGAAATHPDRTH
jgi:hypothetical protein